MAISSDHSIYISPSSSKFSNKFSNKIHRSDQYNRAAMLSLKPFNYSTGLRPSKAPHQGKNNAVVVKSQRFAMVKCTAGDEDDKGQRRSFLSLEEAGLVEISGLSTHERFLCRLTISSLNLLRVISEQEGLPIEELNAGRICDWFLKDKLKREQDLESAVLQWDDSDFQI